MKRFIECLIPHTECNLKCEYCYVIQDERPLCNMLKMNYSPEYIGNCLSVERLGGISYISICASGETMIGKDVIDIIYNILKQGHYVNVTTNGTISKRFAELIDVVPDEYMRRLHFAFSFHFIELRKKNMLSIFFHNIELIKKHGASFVVQVNLCDAYASYWDEIKRLVHENTGAYPQVALTRDVRGKKWEVYTDSSYDEYVRIGKEMDSPLFDFTVKNFMHKYKEYCYAGDWSGRLNLATGVLMSCYGIGIVQNIFEDINKKIKFEAIGHNCTSNYCVNGSHFMALGVMPSVDVPTYAELRNREGAGWYTDEVKRFLSSKLYDDNEEYGFVKKVIIDVKGFARIYKKKVKGLIKSKFK